MTYFSDVEISIAKELGIPSLFSWTLIFRWFDIIHPLWLLPDITCNHVTTTMKMWYASDVTGILLKIRNSFFSLYLIERIFPWLPLLPRFIFEGQTQTPLKRGAMCLKMVAQLVGPKGSNALWASLFEWVAPLVSSKGSNSIASLTKQIMDARAVL